MDIIIFDKEFNYSRKLITEICECFEDFRVIFISDDEEEFQDFVKSSFFDVAIMEADFVKTYPEILDYNAAKICTFEKVKKHSSKFMSVTKGSKRELRDCLTKILLNSLPKNTEIRQAIRRELEYLGYNMSFYGTRYLEETINLIYLKNCECNLEKEVYEQLSKKYNRTAHSIKVNIQNSTNLMLDNGGYDKVLKYLDLDCNYGVGTKAIVFTILSKMEKKYKKNQKTELKI